MQTSVMEDSENDSPRIPSKGTQEFQELKLVVSSVFSWLEAKGFKMQVHHYSQSLLEVNNFILMTIRKTKIPNKFPPT